MLAVPGPPSPRLQVLLEVDRPTVHPSPTFVHRNCSEKRPKIVGENTAGARRADHIEPDVFHISAELKGVFPLGPKGVVIKLIRIPSV